MNARDNIHLRLVRILGQRSFAVFFFVTLLVVAILASVNIASRYALKQYVEEQLQRMPWDITAYQTGDVAATATIANSLQTTPGIIAGNELLFLRNSMTTEDIAYIDNEPIRLPWLSLLTMSDTSNLPANIRPVDGKAVLVLVGTKAQMGDAYAELQNKKHFAIKIEDHHHGDGAGHDDTATSHSGESTAVDVFDIDLERTIRIERKDLNRWFLEQASSPALIPEVGAILVTPYDKAIISAFDALARGIVTVHHDGDIHEEAGSYFPDIIHLLKADTARLISGWDINGSLANLTRLQEELQGNTFAIGPRVFIDNSARVLLERMKVTAEQIGLLSLLIAIPLVWVGWVLMANLSSMLLLNERRKFGLLRLRGASGVAMGRALLFSIAVGALAGGTLGAVLGTVLPLWLYERSWLPLTTILIVQQPYLILTFIVVGVAVALGVSRTFVRFAATISPLEASGRVSGVALTHGERRFGPAGALALVVGSYKILGWVFGFSFADIYAAPLVARTDRLLDFVGFPLFVFGLVSLFVSRTALLNRVLGMFVAAIGGPLRQPIAKHIATRPQRVAGFLLITAMMTTIGVYPTVMTAVFDEKIDRGTKVQTGSDIQVTLNASDIVSNELLSRGGIAEQHRALQQRIPAIIDAFRQVPGVTRASWTLIEGVSDGVYMPGYGFNGLPTYFLPDSDNYLDTVYHEPSLGQRQGFSQLIRRLPAGQVVLSPAVASFTKKTSGDTTQLGRKTDGKTLLEAEVAGSIFYLPGSPAVSVTDRESFDTARIDYVNHLFSNNAYIVADPNVIEIRDLDILITGVQFAIDVSEGSDPIVVKSAILRDLPIEPSAIRSYEEELKKVGSDMYIYLARANVRIYLLGGLFLAIIGILSVAHTNYLEDRRTLALLRIRGAGRGSALRFFGAGIFAPTLIGLVFGVAVALTVGYGITNVVWELREVKNILSYLDTHLAVSEATLLVIAALLVVIAAIGVLFSQWVFRKSVREGLSES